MKTDSIAPKDKAKQGIKELVEKFKNNYQQFHNNDYNEARTREDFINHFFERLGWDIANKQGLSQTYREVVVEDKVKVGKETKAPDYAFRFGGTRLFFVEAKKPSVKLKDNANAAYQIRRYSWSGKLGISILTNFEEFAIYDCSKKPSSNDKASTARVEYISYENYLDKFDFIYDTFAKENVIRGSLEKYNADTKGKKGTQSVDDDFLDSLDDLRTKLASNISKLNTNLSVRDLNFAVQHIIDRIIFLRVAEDRGIEDYGVLRNACSGGEFYKNIVEIFKKADGKYNSGIFDFTKDKITPNIKIENKIFKELINDLYYPKSPYEFSVISIEIIGNAYEQFLGKTITIGAGHKAKIELKPEVRKAGGVYYTPEYIVDYIVANTLGEKIKGKKPEDIAKIKILDPACGSGSFLLGAYKFLLNYHKEYYNKHSKSKFKGSKEKVLNENGELTLWIKKRILQNNIFGVDIDNNAVEVTKLSLLLKCMENETPASIADNQSLFNERALPSLDDNIKCGNSLIGSDFYQADTLNLDLETQFKINCFDWKKEFSEIFKNGGFDIVIGNPPYVFVKYVEWAENVKNYFIDNFAITNKDNKSKSNQSSKINLYTLFILRANKFLKENGSVSFIVPNGLLRTTTYDMARKFILKNYHIDLIADLKDGVFERVTAPTIIFKFSKSKSNKKALIIDANYKRDGLIDDTQQNSISQSTFLDNVSYAFNIFMNEKESKLFNKIQSYKKNLGNITSQIIEGIICRKDQILSEKLDNELCKKFLGGKNIKKYRIEFKNKYIVFDRTKLHRARPNELWNSDKKIIIQRISGGLHPIVATIDTEKYYTFASTNLITIKDEFKSIYDYEIICAILNSKLANFYYVKNFTNASILTVNISKTFLAQIPLPKIDLKNKKDKEIHDKLVNLVDNIIAINKKLVAENNPDTKTILQRQISTIDLQIDKLVYELYDLNDDEIKLIES